MTDSRPLSFSMKDDAQTCAEFLSWLDRQDAVDYTQDKPLVARFLAERDEGRLRAGGFTDGHVGSFK
jgi:hypothetical protein